MLIDLVIEEDAAVQVLHIFVQRFVSFGEILVLIVQKSDLVLQLPHLLRCVALIRVPSEHLIHQLFVYLQCRSQIFDLLQQFFGFSRLKHLLALLRVVQPLLVHFLREKHGLRLSGSIRNCLV